MNSRTQDILKAVIEEYIKHGQPISSGFLAEESDFDASPATLRNELFDLEESGFLAKPHTSAGRVPTPRGYRFFVDNLLDAPLLSEEEKTSLKECQKFFQLQELLASKTKSLVLGGEDFEDIREAGLLGLLQEPEFSVYDFLLDFMGKAERLRGDFEEVTRSLKSQEPDLYIGEEAEPIIGDNRFSLLLTHAGEHGFVMFFSQTRMDYAKALAFADYLSNI